jgi:hypothetical protein
MVARKSSSDQKGQQPEALNTFDAAVRSLKGRIRDSRQNPTAPQKRKIFPGKLRPQQTC